MLAQGVSAVQKLNESQPWAFVFPHPFAPDLSMKTVLLPVFSLLACHCYIPAEKHCPLSPVLSHCTRAFSSPFPGHCMTKEGTEECCRLLISPTCLALASSFGIAGGSRRHCTAVQLHMLPGCSIPPVHPG